MKIEEYIASGVLESYVLGELSHDEMRKVECMALVHEDIQAELTAIEIAHEELAMRSTESPIEGLQESIWASIHASQSTQEAEAPIVSMESQNAPTSTSNASYRWSAAAGIAALIGVSVFAYTSHQRNDVLAAELNKAQSQHAELASSVHRLEEQQEKWTTDAAIIRSADFLAVQLAGTDNAPNSKARVYWNSKKSEVYLDVQDMATLPSGKVYQLWALDDGVPVDAGIFTPDVDGLVAMQAISSGQAFAITIEDAGGAKSPALETLQVMGEV